jgi:hypothetical protein
MFDFSKNIHRIRKERKKRHLHRLGNLIEDRKIWFEQERFQKDMMYIDKVLNEIAECNTFEQKSKKFKELLNKVGIE